ncbi:MAG: septation protein IspZ [Phenylobacterium sp.]|uniref:inner membrane-spanning protein YciB n=1 Tax=Phenylobacterium sp. TaxID=1871053 RepID=UPI001A4B8332|nr:septation protein IspZ [Phenylobacterium sp.]MBL8772836.1 septation protein IspZ [Phenylobacterium sp.]
MTNLAHAFRPLVNDLFSSLLFAGLLAAGVDAIVATVIAMAAGAGHVLLWIVLRKPVAPLQWASLGLVLVFGTASLFLHDPRFLMAKPTIIYLIVATVMLKRGWMLRYMPPIAAGHGERMMIAYGYVWAGLMLLSAALNLVFAIGFPAQWPLYKAVFPIASKLALFAVQYAHIRAVVRPRVIAAMAQARPASAG